MIPKKKIYGDWKIINYWSFSTRSLWSFVLIFYFILKSQKKSQYFWKSSWNLSWHKEGSKRTITECISIFTAKIGVHSAIVRLESPFCWLTKWIFFHYDWNGARPKRPSSRARQYRSPRFMLQERYQCPRRKLLFWCGSYRTGQLFEPAH